MGQVYISLNLIPTYYLASYLATLFRACMQNVNFAVAMPLHSYLHHMQAHSQKILLDSAFEEKVELFDTAVQFRNSLRIYNCMVYGYSPHS